MKSHFITKSYICIINALWLVLQVRFNTGLLLTVGSSTSAGLGVCELTNQRRLDIQEEEGATAECFRQRRNTELQQWTV